MSDSLYGYIPSKWTAKTFLTLYSLSTLSHVGQATYYRTYWLFGTAVFCGILETFGWAGRLWSSISPTLTAPFDIQSSCTVLGPTPLLAANFVIFGNIIKRLGAKYSRLTPKKYTIIFVSCDFISLLVQGAGGGLAASAKTLEGANLGGYIILGGIVFQLGVIVVFSFCFIEYIIRYVKDTPIHSESRSTRGEVTRNEKIMLGAISFVTFLLFIRGIYRTVELADGWHGPILRTESYFNVFDGGLVVIAIFTYNFFHPGRLLLATSGEEYALAEKEMSPGRVHEGLLP